MTDVVWHMVAERDHAAGRDGEALDLEWLARERVRFAGQPVRLHILVVVLACHAPLERDPVEVGAGNDGELPAFLARRTFGIAERAARIADGGTLLSGTYRSRGCLRLRAAPDGTDVRASVDLWNPAID